jgi:hypothetical protein
VVLPERQPVVVARGEVADVEIDQREAGNLTDLPLRKEAIGDAPLIEGLDGASVQPAGTRAREFLV